ncbi:FliG C-terminal domain-containing protein [Klebsiella pneumoniae]
MDSIREVDEDLSGQIEDLMFVFDNLADVDDRGIQALLAEVSWTYWCWRSKAPTRRSAEKVFKNMSKRAAELLRDDLEAKGAGNGSAKWKVRRRKSSPLPGAWPESGDIVLGGKGGEEMI